MRAIETGRWVVHAALSGSSAFIDPDGGVHDATGLFVQDHIRRVVPLAAGRTPFLAIGDVAGRAGAGLLVILLILAVWDRWGRRRHGSDGVPDAGGQRPGGRAAR
jgi:apolipoprotein N-acyltransferase